jgi:hypothetical protein
LRGRALSSGRTYYLYFLYSETEVSLSCEVNCSHDTINNINFTEKRINTWKYYHFNTRNFNTRNSDRLPFSSLFLLIPEITINLYANNTWSTANIHTYLKLHIQFRRCLCNFDISTFQKEKIITGYKKKHSLHIVIIILTTGLQTLTKPLPHWKRSWASSSNLQYRLFSLRSTSGCLRLPPRLFPLPLLSFLQ